MVKIKIEKLAEKTFPKKDGSGDITIITCLLEDGSKIKAWKGKWTEENLKVGKEVEVEIEIKKDRDGFDEKWIKAKSFSGKNYIRNTLPEAYQTAIQWMVATGVAMDMSELDRYALLFKNKFILPEQKPAEKKESTIEKTENKKEIDSEEIPF